jgi:hypothetical protein
MTVGSTGIYQHNLNGGTIPTATWSDGSEVQVTGITSTVPGGLAQSFANFTWNSPQTGRVDLAGALTTVRGNFKVLQTSSTTVCSSGYRSLVLVSGTASPTITIGGDFIGSGNTSLNLNLGTGSPIINVGGNFNFTGGYLMSQDGGTGSPIVYHPTNTIFNLTGAGKTFSEAATDNGNTPPVGGWLDFTCSVAITSNVDFVVTNGASLTLSSGLPLPGSSTNSLAVNSGGTLNTGTLAVTGSGPFTLASGGTLGLGSTAGITSSGATGNIQVSGTRTFDPGANYNFNGSAAQVTGNGFPATVNGLTINNATGVTLTSGVTVNGTLAFTGGKITTGTNAIILPTTATISGAGAGKYVQGNVQRAFTAAATAFTFPIGDASNYAPVLLSFGSVSTGGNVTAAVTGAACGSPGIDQSKNVNHCWTLTNGSTVYTNYSATFSFVGVGTDADAGATTNDFIVGKQDLTTWTYPAVGTKTATSTQATGMTTMSNFELGESLSVKVNTTTAVACTSPITYGSSTSCTATVTRSSGSNTPSGNVTWSVTGPTNTGSFGASNCSQNTTTGTLTCTASYTPGNYGTGTHQINATYAGDGNFNASNGSGNLTVNKKDVVPGITASNKSYDGGVTASILTRNLTGVVGSDNVTLTGGSATFADKNVGTGKTVTGSGFSLGGTTAGNYNLNPTTATTTADILAAGTTTTITNAVELATDTIMGQSYPVTFSVTPDTGGTPTGNVTVSDGTDYCTGMVADGTCDLTSTTAGTKSLTATYAGDSNYGGSVSSIVLHIVNDYFRIYLPLVER